MSHQRFSSDRQGIVPNAENVYYIDWNSLPLTCPTPAMSLWNSHPQVFIPLHETDKYSCIYCGATYILKNSMPGEVLPLTANADIVVRHLRRLEQLRH